MDNTDWEDLDACISEHEIDVERCSSEEFNDHEDSAEIRHDIFFNTGQYSDPYLPHEGMKFQTYEKAFSFYKAYAAQEGFGVTKRSSRRSKKTNELIDAKFVCSRFGERQKKSSVLNPRPSTKIGCPAAMHVKKKETDENWMTYLFTKEHNHELLKENSRFFRSHRIMDTPTKNNIRNLRAVGVQTSKIYAAIPKQSGGYENMGCLEKDIRNELDKERRLAIESGDAQAMHEHFIHMQEENPNFFYALKLDSEHRLQHVLWVDAKARHDYVNFADVVSFDTTYITNKYKMPFAPFVGVNHHGQSMLLGCALVADETSSTFVWLMKTWLRAMGGVAPKAIITDQDRAMKIAIAEVFPQSRHRFCLWHITKKLPDKLGHVIRQHKDFMSEFNKCIYRSWTEEEFESRWYAFLTRFNLLENEWLQSLHEDRRNWIPTFMRDTFFAGMSTSQRSESINSFFDKYVSRKTTLKEFIDQYEVALHDRCEKETLADFQTWNTRPALKSPSPYELQMSALYTREIFTKFQIEIMGAHACHATKDKEDGPVITYKVYDMEQKCHFMVAWEEGIQEISCLCRSFEFRGFLCRHAIIVLQFSGVYEIPSHYILMRWTKDAKSGHRFSQKPKTTESRVQRYNHICQRAVQLAQEGSRSQESYDIVLSIIEQGFRKCFISNEHAASVSTNNNQVVDKASIIPPVMDPVVTKTKGAPSKRIMSWKDKGKQKKQGNTGNTNAKKSRVPQEVASRNNIHFIQESSYQMEQFSSKVPIVDGYQDCQDRLPNHGQSQTSSQKDIFTSHVFSTQQSLYGMEKISSNAPVDDYNFLQEGMSSQEKISSNAPVEESEVRTALKGPIRTVVEGPSCHLDATVVFNEVFTAR